MEGLAEDDVGNNSVLVVGADFHTSVEFLQPEEESQLKSIPTKGQGKQNADQIINFDSKL